MSAPRRTPLSSITVTLSPTAALIAGKASSEAGAWSSWRPPWFETMMPSTPISAARTASAGFRMPLTTSGARKEAPVALEVAPGLRRGRGLTAAESDDVRRARAIAGVRRPIPEGRRAAEPHIFDDPGGVGDGLQQDRRLQLQRFHDAAAADAGKAVPVVALALRMHRHIDGQHQRARAAVSRPPDQCIRNVAVFGRIKLEPDVVRGDPQRFFHRGVAAARHDVGDVRRRRGFGQHHLAFPPVEADAAGRRDPERARIGAAEHGRRLVAFRHVDQVARQQPVLVERGFVAREAALVLHPALDVIEDDARQLALRDPMQVFDVDGLIEVHGLVISYVQTLRAQSSRHRKSGPS